MYKSESKKGEEFVQLENMRTAFLGLGAMGTHMARHLRKLGPTLVWNRTAAVAEAHALHHGTTALARLEQAADADAVFTCLPTSRQVEWCVDKLLDAGMRDTLWIDCTSGAPPASKAIAARLEAAGCAFVDAPLSGGPAGAEQGALTVMVGGTSEDFGRAQPLLDTFAAKLVHVGPVGAGHTLKALNNLLASAQLLLGAEALLALKKAGVEPSVALEVLNASSGGSFATQRLIPGAVLPRHFGWGFKLPLMTKDCKIARELLSPEAAPLLAAAAHAMEDAQRELGDERDFTEAVRVAERRAGIEIKDEGV